MKRDNLFTKLVALLLCALMVAAWLPNASVAVNAADFETDIDVVDPTEPAPEGPIVDETLNFSDISLSLQSDIRATFLLKTSDITKKGYTNVRISIKHTLEDGTVNETILSENTSSTSLRMAYKYSVWAQYMDDEMEVVIYADDAEGKTHCSNTIIWSLRDTAMTKLAGYIKGGYAANATLVVDMLNYGAEAQLQFKYREESLANRQLSEEQKAMATQETPEVKTTNTAPLKTNNELNQYNLNVKDKVGLSFVMRLPVDANPEDYQLAVTFEGKTTMIGHATYAKLKNYALCSFLFTDLAANNMRKDVSAQLYLNGEPVSTTYTATVAAVANDKFSTMPVAVAMMKYGDSVIACFGDTN